MTKVNLKDCKSKILETAKDILSDSDAEEFVKALELRIANFENSELLSIEQKVQKAGEEMSDEIDRISLINKRNSLLTIERVRSMKKSAKTYTTSFEGLLAFLEDSRQSIQGAGRGVNSVVEGYKAKYLGELKSRLEESGLMDDFRKDRLEREIFQEFYKPGSSGNEKARKIRDIMFALKQDTVEHQNLYGSFIHFLPEHVKRQVYNPSLIKKAFGPQRFKNVLNFSKHLTPEEYDETFRAFAEFMTPLLDKESTFKDSEPEKFLRGAFDGIMSGKHGAMEAANGAEINAKFFKAGALAKKISNQRILHFKDGDAAFTVHQLLSDQKLSGGFIAELEKSATNIGLMQMLGPNPKAALETVVDELEYEFSRSGQEKQLKSLQDNKHRLFSALSFLDRSASIPENPTMASATASVISILSQAKLGKLLLFALPDKALLQSTLTRNGVRGMDALVKALRLTKPSNRNERLRLMMMGGEIKSFMNTVNSRFSTGSEGMIPSYIHNSQKFFFNMTGINWMDDVGTDAVIGALVRHVGAMADRSFDELVPELKYMFKSFDISPKEWDVWRSTVYSIDGDGKVVEGMSGNDNWISPDRFKDIPDNVIDSLLPEGQKPTDASRKKQKDLLESKFRSWLISQRDEAVLMPGSKEHRLSTFGTKAGTGVGSMMRLIMMFKSFPITIYTKILRREIQGRDARTFMEWIKAEKNSNFHTLQLIAMSTIAGYISLTIDDLLMGKEPRTFTDRRDEINPELAITLLRDSFVRGGAGGLHADLLLREYNEGYKNALKSVGGPFVNEVSKGAALFSDAVRGRATASEAINFARGNTPYLNLFYVKPALDHLLFFNLQEMLSPGSLREMERRTLEDFGQEYWSKPSESAK